MFTLHKVWGIKNKARSETGQYKKNPHFLSHPYET